VSTHRALGGPPYPRVSPDSMGSAAGPSEGREVLGAHVGEDMDREHFDGQEREHTRRVFGNAECLVARGARIRRGSSQQPDSSLGAHPGLQNTPTSAPVCRWKVGNARLHRVHVWKGWIGGVPRHARAESWSGWMFGGSGVMPRSRPRRGESGACRGVGPRANVRASMWPADGGDAPSIRIGQDAAGSAHAPP
jgi:hypothetical protein